ncbi:MAG: hypothetical protein HY812_20430 [Planctomycetes bacterium]|nr:hypothetical protein [Planctomycetota bacterium]
MFAACAGRALGQGLLFLLAVPAGGSPAAQEEPRPAAKILAEFDAVRFPGMSADASEDGARRFKQEIEVAARVQVDLALELHRAHPEHARVPEAMAARWALMSNALGRANEVLAEVEELLAAGSGGRLGTAALFARARAGLVAEDVPAEEKRAFVEEAIARDPGDPLGGVHLIAVAKYHTQDVEEMRALCERVLAEWPDEAYASAPARGFLVQLDRIGKPLPLEFRDVLSGETIDAADLRGHPVLVHLWSGFHGEMGGELERVRQLHAALGPRGLKVVGVHLWGDAGGEEALKAALAARGIAWPQCCEAAAGQEPWEGRFRTGEVPLCFLLDEAGVVRSVSYRVRNLVPAAHRMLGAV